MKKEKQLFDLVENFDEDNNHGLGFGVHITEDTYPEFGFIVYHKDGYCFNVDKEHHCEPNEIEEYIDIYELQSDGCTYSFGEGHYDGFNPLSIDEAIELMKQTTQK